MFHEFFVNVAPEILLAFAAPKTSANSSWFQPFQSDPYCNRYAVLLYNTAVGTTLDMGIQQAQDSSGTGAKNIADSASTALAITQLVAADDNYLVSLDFGPGALDEKNGFTYVQVQVTASGTCNWGVLGFRYFLRQPGQFNWTSTYYQTKSGVLMEKGVTIKRYT